MKKLKLTVPFKNGESVASLASRTAAANGLPGVHMLAQHLEFSFQRLSRGHPEDLDRFAGLIGIDPTELTPGVMVPHGALHEVMGQRVELLGRNRLRICPHCIVDDEASSGGRRGHRAFGRVAWSIRAVRTCPVHCTALITSDFDAEQRHVNDFAVLLRIDRPRMNLFQKQSVAVRRDALQIHVEERLAGKPTMGGWLQSLPLHVVVKMSEYIGAIMRHGVNFEYAALGEREWSECADEGFAVMASGIKGFQQFLGTLHAPYFKSKFGMGGQVLYGRLFSMLKNARKDPSYDPITKIVRETAVDFLPLGPGDHFLGPVEKRLWHSVTTASAEFGIHFSRLKKLLIGEGLVSPDAALFSNNRILVEAEIVERFLMNFADGLTAEQAQARLNIPRDHFSLLVKAGHLQRITPRFRVNDVQARYHPAEVERLLSRMEELVTTDEVSPRMVDLGRAKRFANATIGEIQTLLFKGELERVAMDPSSRGYLAIRIDRLEVVRKTKLPSHGLIPIRLAERMLQMQAQTVRALIKGGHLNVTIEKNPDCRRRQFYLQPSEVERFKREFASLPRLARLRTVARPKMKAFLESNSILPIIDPALAGASVFRISEIPQDLRI